MGSVQHHCFPNDVAPSLCRTVCSSQCNQKTDLMEETRQYIYTSTLLLTCGFLGPKRGPKVGYNIFLLRQPGLEFKISWLWYHVELHALANATKRPIWWKTLGNTFILQYSPSRVASSGLNVDRKWAAIFLFYIAPSGFWTQDLLALIPCRTIGRKKYGAIWWIYYWASRASIYRSASNRLGVQDKT
jgi:hypothetical protein